MNFIEKYVDYASEFTDAPKIIHYRVALTLISTCLKRNLYLIQGHKWLFPNLFSIIIARSSFFRKSYSLSIAEDILREIDPRFILPSEFSRERFVQDLHEQPNGLLCLYEMSNFLEMSTRDYNAGTISLLTELYDNPPLYERKTLKGTITIEKPFVNILAASTLDWLVRSLKSSDVTGGFFPRFLIILAGEKTKSIPFQPEANQLKRQNLIDMLKEYELLSGKMWFNSEAIKEYEKWYINYEKRFENENPMLSPFYVRLTEYAKKFAMILNVDYGKGLEIGKEVVKDACNMALGFAEETKCLIQDKISVSRFDMELKRVEELIKNGKMIGRSDLLKKTKISSKYLNDILKTLLESEKIEEIKENFNNSQGADRERTKYQWLHNEDN